MDQVFPIQGAKASKLSARFMPLSTGVLNRKPKIYWKIPPDIKKLIDDKKSWLYHKTPIEREENIEIGKSSRDLRISEPSSYPADLKTFLDYAIKWPWIDPQTKTRHHFLPICHLSDTSPDDVAKAFRRIKPNLVGYEGFDVDKEVFGHLLNEILSASGKGLTTLTGLQFNVIHRNLTTSGKLDDIRGQIGWSCEMPGLEYTKEASDFYKERGICAAAERQSVFFEASKRQLRTIPAELKPESFVMRKTEENVVEFSKSLCVSGAMQISLLFGVHEENLNNELARQLIQVFGVPCCDLKFLEESRTIDLNMLPEDIYAVHLLRDLGMALKIQRVSEQNPNTVILWVLGAIHVDSVRGLIETRFNERDMLETLLNQEKEFEIAEIVKISDRSIRRKWCGGKRTITFYGISLCLVFYVVFNIKKR